jgi:hypothetical protein
VIFERVPDDVESDLKKMKVKGWKEKMRNREQWGLVVEEPKAHQRPVAPSGRLVGRQIGTRAYLKVDIYLFMFHLTTVLELRTVQS